MSEPHSLGALFGDRFAPTTRAFGLLDVPMASLAAELVEWRREYVSSFGGIVKGSEVPGTLENALLKLPPLETAGVREVLVPTRSQWIGYFNSFLSGTDAYGPVSVLSKRMMCRGFAVVAAPRVTPTVSAKTGYMDSLGGFMFSYYESGKLVRNVSLGYESRWEFSTYGEPLPQEDSSTYNLPKLTDRFGREQLVKLLGSFGLFPLDPDFYMPDGGPAVLVERVMDKPSPVLFDWHRRPWKG